MKLMFINIQLIDINFLNIQEEPYIQNQLLNLKHFYCKKISYTLNTSKLINDDKIFKKITKNIINR